MVDVSDAAPHSSTSVYDMISHIIAKQLATATIYFTMYEVHHFEASGKDLLLEAVEGGGRERTTHLSLRFPFASKRCLTHECLHSFHRMMG